MQELIQPLEQNPGFSPAKMAPAVTLLPDPSKDIIRLLLPANNSVIQGYTIQEDMEGFTGELGGLFGM